VPYSEEYSKMAPIRSAINIAEKLNNKSFTDIKKTELMGKALGRKSQTSILFVVDASGSMGVEDLMIKTKGLVFEILKDAYIMRERVGFITFRGTQAKVILHFTKSIEMAKEKLKDIKTGGKTPLSRAMERAYLEIEKEIRKEKDNEIVLLIFSDGRANISVTGMDPFEEAVAIARKFSEKKVKTFVVDTDPTWIHYPYAKDLAKAIKGKYLKLKDILDGNIRELIYD